jgi:hypothetical protein
MTLEAKGMLSSLIWAALICLLLFAIFGCGYAKHKDPDTFYESSRVAAGIAASLHARDIGGSVYQNECCGSMEPLIHKGDWIVARAEPYSDELLGKVVSYRRANGQLLMHRLVSGNAVDGFIASGDNNKRSEPDERVDAGNYLETCVAIYRLAE